jgi:hypothetical protein
MSLTFVQGDTAPDITSQLTRESDGLPVDLTNASVRFQMRRPDDRRFTVNAVATVSDAAQGRVGYAWSANDLAVPGDYAIQWEITFQSGKVQTTAATETITIRRQ